MILNPLANQGLDRVLFSDQIRRFSQLKRMWISLMTEFEQPHVVAFQINISSLIVYINLRQYWYLRIWSNTADFVPTGVKINATTYKDFNIGTSCQRQARTCFRTGQLYSNRTVLPQTQLIPHSIGFEVIFLILSSTENGPLKPWLEFHGLFYVVHFGDKCLRQSRHQCGVS